MWGWICGSGDNVVCVGCGPLAWCCGRPGLRLFLRSSLLMGCLCFRVLVWGLLACGPLGLFTCRIFRSFVCCCASNVGVAKVVSL